MQKFKASLTGIAFQPVNQAEAATKQAKEFCTAQWYTIAALTVLTILLIVYICLSNQKCTLIQKKNLFKYSKLLCCSFQTSGSMFPVKLCKSAGSIHLFQLYGQLDPNQIILEKNCLWDMIKIDWKEVFLTLNGTIVRMPKTVKVPLRDKYRLRTPNGQTFLVATCYAETRNILVCIR